MEYLVSDFSAFIVTGVDCNGRRFRHQSANYRHAAAINVWNGTLWGVLRSTGKRVRLTRYSN